MEDLIEVVHASYTCKYKDAIDASNHLAKFPANIRLDLHGVLDVLDVNTQLVNDREMNKIVCISFVGPNAYNPAKLEIQSRIQTGQIDYGVLVFKRGNGPCKYQYIEEGSKAWVNMQIPKMGMGMEKSLFIDDSTDHLRSTAYLIDDIDCKLFNTGISKQLLSMIQKWTDA